MKFEVPFYKQENKNDCGATALQMVLEYLGEIHSKKELMDLVDSDKSGVTWTSGLARAAAKLGFKTEFFSICIGFNIKNYDLDYYKKEADEVSLSKQKLERINIDSQKLGVKMEERSLSLNELLAKISKNCLPIVLLDWSKIKGTKEFIGHFVPIVGYDEDSVYIHNQGFHNTKAFLPIEKKLFEESRKSKGTDEDIIFIHRKSK